MWKLLKKLMGYAKKGYRNSQYFLGFGAKQAIIWGITAVNIATEIALPHLLFRTLEPYEEPGSHTDESRQRSYMYLIIYCATFIGSNSLFYLRDYLTCQMIAEAANKLEADIIEHASLLRLDTFRKLESSEETSIVNCLPQLHDNIDKYLNNVFFTLPSLIEIIGLLISIGVGKKEDYPHYYVGAFIPAIFIQFLLYYKMKEWLNSDVSAQDREVKDSAKSNLISDLFEDANYQMIHLGSHVNWANKEIQDALKKAKVAYLKDEGVLYSSLAAQGSVKSIFIAGTALITFWLVTRGEKNINAFSFLLTSAIFIFNNISTIAHHLKKLKSCQNKDRENV